MYAVRPPLSPDWSLQVAPNIRLHNWTVDDDVLNCPGQQPAPAVSIRIVLSGELRCALQDQEIDIRGPSLCVLAPAGRYPIVQLLGRKGRLRVVGIDFHDDPSQGAWPSVLSELTSGLRCAHSIDCGSLHYCTAQEHLTAVATQIVTCPFQGKTRDLHLIGMAFQLIALVVETMDANAAPSIKARTLSPRDLERVDCVKCILRDRCQRPPTLDMLARSVGISPKRLTTLFKQECGVGIADFLQDYRLEQAFRLVAHTNLQISEVAYQVGYSAAHFSTAFKKRFGRQPSELRGPVG